MRAPRVGLLEARMSGELSALVRRHGLEPRVAPALREVALDAAGAVGALIDALARGEVKIVVFLTGVGAASLFDAADRLGRSAELAGLLRGTINLCRGQKPWQALKRHEVPISVTAEAPYTTVEVLRALAEVGQTPGAVALVHYGERNDLLSETLTTWGRTVHEICLYQWQLPEDTRPMQELVEEVVAGKLDAVAFTSQIQIRHLLQVAVQFGRGVAFLDALNERTVVAAVGPSCAAGLESVGIRPKVIPSNPKMGPMVVALAEYLRSHPSNKPPLIPEASPLATG